MYFNSFVVDRDQNCKTKIYIEVSSNNKYNKLKLIFETLYALHYMRCLFLDANISFLDYTNSDSH